MYLVDFIPCHQYEKGQKNSFHVVSLALTTAVAASAADAC